MEPKLEQQVAQKVTQALDHMERRLELFVPRKATWGGHIWQQVVRAAFRFAWVITELFSFRFRSQLHSVLNKDVKNLTKQLKDNAAAFAAKGAAPSALCFTTYVRLKNIEILFEKIATERRFNDPGLVDSLHQLESDLKAQIPPMVIAPAEIPVTPAPAPAPTPADDVRPMPAPAPTPSPSPEPLEDFVVPAPVVVAPEPDDDLVVDDLPTSILDEVNEESPVTGPVIDLARVLKSDELEQALKDAIAHAPPHSVEAPAIETPIGTSPSIVEPAVTEPVAVPAAKPADEPAPPVATPAPAPVIIESPRAAPLPGPVIIEEPVVAPPIVEPPIKEPVATEPAIAQPAPAPAPVVELPDAAPDVELPAPPPVSPKAPSAPVVEEPDAAPVGPAGVAELPDVVVAAPAVEAPVVAPAPPAVEADQGPVIDEEMLAARFPWLTKASRRADEARTNRVNALGAYVDAVEKSVKAIVEANAKAKSATLLSRLTVRRTATLPEAELTALAKSKATVLAILKTIQRLQGEAEAATTAAQRYKIEWKIASLDRHLRLQEEEIIKRGEGIFKDVPDDAAALAQDIRASRQVLSQSKMEFNTTLKERHAEFLVLERLAVNEVEGSARFSADDLETFKGELSVTPPGKIQTAEKVRMDDLLFKTRVAREVLEEEVIPKHFRKIKKVKKALAAKSDAINVLENMLKAWSERQYLQQIPEAMGDQLKRNKFLLERTYQRIEDEDKLLENLKSVQSNNREIRLKQEEITLSPLPPTQVAGVVETIGKYCILVEQAAEVTESILPAEKRVELRSLRIKLSMAWKVQKDPKKVVEYLKQINQFLTTTFGKGLENTEPTIRQTITVLDQHVVIAIRQLSLLIPDKA